MNRLLVPAILLLLSINTTAQTRIDPSQIDIVRDSFGVPHIFAKTDAEVAYGLAWAHAEDDFESLQEVVLPAKNMMGRVMGKKAVAGDYAFRLFRCMEITEEKWNTLSPAFVKVAEAYTQALNDFAKKYPGRVLHKKIFPITVKEYIASSVLALTVFNGVEGPLTSIFNNRMATIPQLQDKGSNASAIHPSKTNTGEAFLLVNAHQPNTGPQAFYEAHVCSEEGWNALGGLLAGGPCILHGVNEHLGWAHTVNYCDRTDVFQLEMNPENALQYKFDGQWVNLEKKKVTLRIKGIPIGIKKAVYWSKYGATMKNKQGFFSIRLGANMRIGALDQWYQMNKAKNFSEFYSAISRQELSMFNITYADKHDTIFYINNALMPVRNDIPGFKWSGTMPGNTSKTLWTEFRSIRELPQYINPSSGFLFNTNHSSFFATAAKDNLDGKKFPVTDGWENWHNNRSKRFLELMPADKKIGIEELRNIKFDRQLPNPMHYLYNIDTLLNLPPGEYPEYAGIINTLHHWDRKGVPESRGAAMFLLTYEFLKNKLRGQLGRKIKTEEALATLQHIKEYTTKYFGRTDITLGELQKLVRGKEEWPLGGFPDLLAPQWTEKQKNGTLKSIGGDGYIMFIRFPHNGLPVIETVNMYGASAQPGNKHFNDQVPLYLNDRTKPMTLDKKKVYASAERIYHPE